MRERDADILQSIVATRGGFGHRENLQLVWSYLQIYEPLETHRAVRAAVRHMASAHGAPDT